MTDKTRTVLGGLMILSLATTALAAPGGQERTWDAFKVCQAQVGNGTDIQLGTLRINGSFTYWYDGIVHSLLFKQCMARKGFTFGGADYENGQNFAGPALPQAGQAQ